MREQRRTQSMRAGGVGTYEYDKYQLMEPWALTRKSQNFVDRTRYTGNWKYSDRPRFGRGTCCRFHEIQPYAAVVVDPQSSSGLDNNTVNTTLRRINNRLIVCWRLYCSLSISLGGLAV